MLTLVKLCNHYLEAKVAQVQRGELSPVTFSDYFRICNNAAEIIGKTKPIKSLGPTDFDRLRSKLAETRHLTTRKAELQKIKSIFNDAYHLEQIDKPFRLKVLLKTPLKKSIRGDRNEREPQMMEPPELRTILLTVWFESAGGPVGGKFWASSLGSYFGGNAQRGLTTGFVLRVINMGICFLTDC